MRRLNIIEYGTTPLVNGKRKNARRRRRRRRRSKRKGEVEVGGGKRVEKEEDKRDLLLVSKDGLAVDRGYKGWPQARHSCGY